jgi:hypothetical protein
MLKLFDLCERITFTFRLSLCWYPNDLAAVQAQLPSFRNLQRSSLPPTEVIEKAVFRGWLTLKAMEMLPIAEYPELASTANFWAPVQAYYALHGIGLACLAALQTTAPDDHRAFRASTGEQLVLRLLPSRSTSGAKVWQSLMLTARLNSGIARSRLHRWFQPVTLRTLRA